MKLRIVRAAQAAPLPSRESKHIEFKERIDVDSTQDWCELLKDLIAIANSGGGEILVGLFNNGSPSGWNPSPLLALDPAKIVDKIASYTGEQFSDVEIYGAQKDGTPICRIMVGAPDYPLPFVRPGTYPVAPDKQKAAFAAGTVYFRHGAKSEPAVGSDFRRFVERRVGEIRKSWMGNIRKVVHAPEGSRVSVLPSEIIESALPAATPIRLVEDPTAPAYRKISPDLSHPNRSTEVVVKVNARLGGKRKISSFDIQCVRKVHRVDESKPQWFYKSKFASPQYSETFVDWIISQYEADGAFFDKTREEQKKIAAQKP